VFYKQLSNGGGLAMKKKRKAELVKIGSCYID
jgi:hypothetical protein